MNFCPLKVNDTQERCAVNVLGARYGQQPLNHGSEALARYVADLRTACQAGPQLMKPRR